MRKTILILGFFPSTIQTLKAETEKCVDTTLRIKNDIQILERRASICEYSFSENQKSKKRKRGHLVDKYNFKK